MKRDDKAPRISRETALILPASLVEQLLREAIGTPADAVLTASHRSA